MTTRKSDSKGKAPAKKAAPPRSTGAAPKGTRPSSKVSAPAPRASAPPPKPASAPAPPKSAPLKSAPAKSAKPAAAKAPAKAPLKSALKGAKSAPAPPPAPKAAPPPPAPRKPTAPPLRESDLKKLEELLLAERGRLLRELGHLENTVLKRSMRETSGELSGYSFHMADVGTDAMEREKAFHFASSEGRALLDVDDALRRLYGGNYGTCESCLNPVGRERLEVVPHARLCVACKQKEERSQSGRT